jgi:hypothetical protein
MVAVTELQNMVKETSEGKLINKKEPKENVSIMLQTCFIKVKIYILFISVKGI